MASPLIAVVGFLGLVVFVLVGMVVELYLDVRQIREAVGILDRPLEVDIGGAADRVPSAFGLPHDIDRAAAAIVLFLSDRCGTCHSLAASFGGRLPAGLILVLEARDPRSAGDFLQRYDLPASAADGRVLIDVAGRIAQRLGLRTTPVGFFVEDGRFVRATTVPSRRYLTTILPTSVRLDSQRSPSPLPKGEHLEWA